MLHFPQKIQQSDLTWTRLQTRVEVTKYIFLHFCVFLGPLVCNFTGS